MIYSKFTLYSKHQLTVSICAHIYVFLKIGFTSYNRTFPSEWCIWQFGNESNIKYSCERDLMKYRELLIEKWLLRRDLSKPFHLRNVWKSLIFPLVMVRPRNKWNEQYVVHVLLNFWTWTYFVVGNACTGSFCPEYWCPVTDMLHTVYHRCLVPYWRLTPNKCVVIIIFFRNLYLREL